MYMYMYKPCTYMYACPQGKCFALSGSTYLALFIVSELQRLGILEAAAKASSKGKWNKDTAKVSFCAFPPQSLKLPLNCFLYLYYRIAGNIGGEINLAVWRSISQLPN